MLILRAFVLASTVTHLRRERECLLRMGIEAPSRSPAMIASSGKPGSGRGTAVFVSVVPVHVLMLELISDELVELSVLIVVEPDVSVLVIDVDSVVDEDVADVVVVDVVLVVCISIPVPQCTSIPESPAAQPSSVARKLALLMSSGNTEELCIKIAFQLTPSQWKVHVFQVAPFQNESPIVQPSVELPGTMQIVLRLEAPVTAFCMATRLHWIPS